MREKIYPLENKDPEDFRRDPPPCFEKNEWYFQSECRNCLVNKECKDATLRRRDLLIQYVNEAIERDKRAARAYDIIHPKILNYKYHFLDD
jgi:hypothetical protein